LAATIRIEVTTSGGLDSVKKDVADLGRAAQKDGGGGFSALGEIATGALRKIGEMVVNVGVAAFQKFGQVIGDSISIARESNQINAQTAQVIKSTGEAAGVTTQHVQDYAASLDAASGKSLFSQEQIQQSSNLLLTFTNLKGGILDAATAISTDMAQALGGAPKDAAIQLGKALNDPVKGITALTRVGVTFSGEQKAMIKAMTEAGDTAGAQKVILNELNKEFGGSAAAAAAADGGFAQFQGQLQEMEKTIGQAILPILGQLMGALNTTLMPIIASVADGFKTLVGDMSDAFGDGGIGAAINVFLNELFGLDTNVGFVINDIITTFTTLISDVSSAFQDGGIGAAINVVLNELLGLDTNIGFLVDDSIAGLQNALQNNIIPAFQAVWTVIQTQVMPILSDLATAVVPLLGAAIQVLAGFWTNVLVPAVMVFWNVLTTVVLPVIAALAGWLRDNLPGAIQSVADWLTGTLFPAFHQVYDFISVNVIPILADVAKWLIDNVPVAIQKTTDFWNNTLWPALNKVWVFIQDNVIPIIVKISTEVFDALNKAVQDVSTFWTNTLWPALQKVWAFIQDSVIPLLTALANVAIALVKKEVELLAALWNNVLWPALNKVWAFISDNIIPIMKQLVEKYFADLKVTTDAIAKLWNDVLYPALMKVYQAVYDHLAPTLATFNDNVLQPMQGFFSDIGTSVQDLIQWINELVKKINAVKIPDWLQGHSPPPMAEWFSYIGESVKGVNQQLPTLAMNLAAQLGPTGSSISNTASTRSFTYAPTVYQSGGGDMPMDLALASSLASV